MTLEIAIYSDVICPWCFVGKRRLERALDQTGLRAQAKVTWLPFELNPDMPDEGMPRSEYRLRKFGPARAAALDAEMAERGDAEGIAFAFDRMERTPSTRKAHRLLRFAARSGRDDSLKEALLRAYFIEARDVGDRATLIEVAAKAGFDREDARSALDDQALDAEVEALERRGAELGITGVPFFVVDGSWAVSGAQPTEQWIAALRSRALLPADAAG